MTALLDSCDLSESISLPKPTNKPEKDIDFQLQNQDFDDIVRDCDFLDDFYV